MKKLLLSLSMVLFVVSFSLAQKTVTGTITDTNAEVLIGASVLVKGTSSGTVTDIDGTYSLEVPEGRDMLVISYTGYDSQDVSITGDKVDVVLAEGVNLNEVVVTALGIKREKKTLGYATQEVGGDEVTKVKDANFINSLSGKIAGVDISRSNSMGGSSNVIVRGYTSISGNNQALFIIDGTPINNTNTNTADQTKGRGGYDFGNAASDINPEDIESINVLKGAAATALYGARAANGVILITTKKGSKRKGLGVTVSTGLTMGQVDKSTVPEYQKQYGQGYSVHQGWYADNGFDFYDFGDGDIRSAAVYEDASFGPAFDSNVQALNWESFYPELKDKFGQTSPFVASDNDASNTFFETAKTWNTNVSIDGGTDKSSFRLSFTNFDQSGILPNSSIQKNTVSFNGGYDLTDNLSVSTAINYVKTSGRGRYGTGYDNRNPNQSFRQWYSVATDFLALEEAYLSTGKNLSWNPYGSLDPDRATVPHYFDNQYFNAYENYTTDGRNRIYGNVELNYDVNDWLSATARASTDTYNELQEERIAVGSVDVSKYSRRNLDVSESNLDLYLKANGYLGIDNKINISGLLGINRRENNFQSIFAETNGGLVVPGLYSLSNSDSGIEAPTERVEPRKYNGYYGAVNFGYNQMVYLDVTGRVDQASTLPIDANTYFYPSASLSFILSEVISADALDFAKIRLNYAQVGNDALYDNVFDTYRLGTPFNGVSLATATSTKNNLQLVPERTNSVEGGLELRFLKDRVGLDLSVYRSVTNDLITQVAVTQPTGQSNQIVNAGSIENTGLELALNYTPIKSADFSWDVNVNWSRNQNEVLSLFGDATNLELASVQGGITINARVGQPFGTIVGSNFVYDSYNEDGTAAAGAKPIVSPHYRGDGGMQYNKSATPEVIGDINADWRGGVMNNFRYKNFALGFLIDVKKGGDFFSLDTWYGNATGIYADSAGDNKNGVERRALPVDGGGTFIDGAVVQTGTNDDGLAISDGTLNQEAFYTADVYSSLGYVLAPNAYHVYDASFVKLREVSLTYSLPASMLSQSPFQGVDLSLIGRNLWIIHKNTPYSDPEAGLSAGNIQGYQSGAYAGLKEYGFNLRLRF